MPIPRRLAALALLLLPSAALAQSNVDDIEYIEVDDEEDEKVQVSARFETEYHEYNNLDFRPLDESSDQAILDSDDRGAFAFTGGSLEVGYQVDPQVRLVTAIAHRGLWADDQVGSINDFGGFFYFPALYVDLSTTAEDDGVDFRIGRQFFTIGTLGGARDFILADILDMVRVDVPLGGAGTWTLVPINVFTYASDLNEVNFASFIGQSNAETFNFNGDTLTRRYGTVLTLDGIPGPVDAALYGFYTDVGARGSGSDISFDGLLGNFTDNDWVANMGVRATATFGPVKPFAHFDASTGIDRKELVANNVDTTGYAWGAGLNIDTSTDDSDAGLYATLRYFDSFGPLYDEEGLQSSHGYVGMKAQQTGGTLLNRFKGWHPTAYVGFFGIENNPQDLSRKAGTRVLTANGHYELEPGLVVGGGWWTMMDTGITFLDEADLEGITPPFGYARSEFEAELRLGRVLAHELDIDIGWNFGEYVEVYSNAAVVIPGDFYAFEIDRVAGTALGFTDPRSPWAIHAGTRVRF